MRTGVAAQMADIVASVREDVRLQRAQDEARHAAEMETVRAEAAATVSAMKGAYHSMLTQCAAVKRANAELFDALVSIGTGMGVSVEPIAITGKLSAQLIRILHEKQPQQGEGEDEGEGGQQQQQQQPSTLAASSSSSSRLGLRLDRHVTGLAEAGFASDVDDTGSDSGGGEGDDAGGGGKGGLATARRAQQRAARAVMSAPVHAIMAAALEGDDAAAGVGGGSAAAAKPGPSSTAKQAPPARGAAGHRSSTRSRAAARRNTKATPAGSGSDLSPQRRRAGGGDYSLAAAASSPRALRRLMDELGGKGYATSPEFADAAHATQQRWVAAVLERLARMGLSSGEQADILQRLRTAEHIAEQAKRKAAELGYTVTLRDAEISDLRSELQVRVGGG
jgi:hypothetical protein